MTTETPSLTRDIVIEPALITDFNLVAVFREVSIEQSNGCGIPTVDASGHLVLSHVGTCNCSNNETHFSKTCLVCGLFSFTNSSA